MALALGLLALGLVLASATLIDRRPPGVARVSVSRTAADGRSALTHATIDIEFSEAVERPSVESRFRITPSVAGALSWDGERVLIFTPARKLPIATEFAVHLDSGFRDREGNVNTTEVPSFTFRTVDLPLVTAATPLEGAVGIPLDQPLSLSFDRLMDTELTAKAVRVRPTASLAPTWQGTTLLLTPTAPLASGTVYRLTVGGEAADADGNPLARPFTLAFQTVSTGLGATMLSPSDGSAGASPQSPIAIVFDRAIDPDSVVGALSVTPPVDGRLEVVGLPRDDSPPATPGSPSGSIASPSAPPVPSSPPQTPALAGPATVLRFTPAAPLAAHTTFTVRLRPGAVRALGSTEVAAGASWTFTTGSLVDVLQNQVVFLSPRTGVDNVWAMNPDGTNARQLTAEITPVTSYDVAGDGRSLVYATAGRVRRTVLPAGGAVSELTPPGLAEYAPRLTPDGRSALVARRERASAADLGLWLVPLVEGAPPERRLLAPGCAGTGETAPPMGSSDAGGTAYTPDGRAGPWSSGAAFSADGTLAIVTCASGGLARLDLVTGIAATLALGAPAGPPAWSVTADAFLVGAADQRGTRRMWWVPRRGPVMPGPAFAAWPAAGPSGSLAGIAVSEPDRVAFQAPGGTPVVLTVANDLLDRQPVFSPGGESILFVRVPRDDPTRSAGVWVVARDGRELRQLSPLGSDPRWLP